jgi:hypothetical protein
MTHDDLLIIWFCVIDDGLKALWHGQRLRQRGPAPILADSEVIMMEVVGEYLGVRTDSAIFTFFRSHSQAFFPKLAHLHRATFVRQAANLYRVKERLWRWIGEDIFFDPQFSIVDSLALHVCPFRRAPRCQRFGGEAAQYLRVGGGSRPDGRHQWTPAGRPQFLVPTSEGGARPAGPCSASALSPTQTRSLAAAQLSTQPLALSD